MSALLDAPLAVIAAAVRDDPAQADALRAESLRRISARDGKLGAVVRLSDAPLLVSSSGALAGVPTLVKDLQADVRDLPLTRGSVAVGTPAPRGDSTLVRRLRDAGAVVLGRTNSAEFGLGITTEPRRYGPTRNPHDPTRSAGGSSGGAAAAVAAGYVPFAHATDSGGSIRIPAAWCGVVGFKPSRGMIPAGPHRLDDWFGLSHEFAITRTVADSRALFDVVRGVAPGEWMPTPGLSRPRGPLRVGLVTQAPGGAEVSLPYQRALGQAADALARAGHDITVLPPVNEATQIGALFAGIAGAHIARLLVDEGADEPQLDPAVAEVVARARAMTAPELVGLAHQLHRLSFVISAAFDDVDLVLTPTTAWGPPPLGALAGERASERFDEIFRLSPFAAMFNVTGGPAISVPWGTDESRMPIGLQVGGMSGHDFAVLDIAEAIEQRAPTCTGTGATS